jgi:hypothetical protein
MQRQFLVFLHTDSRDPTGQNSAPGKQRASPGVFRDCARMTANSEVIYLVESGALRIMSWLLELVLARG